MQINKTHSTIIQLNFYCLKVKSPSLNTAALSQSRRRSCLWSSSPPRSVRCYHPTRFDRRQVVLLRSHRCKVLAGKGGCSITGIGEDGVQCPLLLASRIGIGGLLSTINELDICYEMMPQKIPSVLVFFFSFFLLFSCRLLVLNLFLFLKITSQLNPL